MYGGRDSGSDEDLIEYNEASGAPRAVRGTIVSETFSAILLRRRDGDQEISRRVITKVIRRSPEAQASLKKHEERVSRQLEMLAILDRATEGGKKIASLREVLGIEEGEDGDR